MCRAKEHVHILYYECFTVAMKRDQRSTINPRLKSYVELVVDADRCFLFTSLSGKLKPIHSFERKRWQQKKISDGIWFGSTLKARIPLINTNKSERLPRMNSFNLTLSDTTREIIR